jgi:hypothetical protein
MRSYPRSPLPLLLLFLSLFVACGPRAGIENAASSGGGFRIHRLSPKQGQDMPTHYGDPAWASLLAEASLGDVLVEDGDIAWYEWSTQRVALSPPASKALSEKMERDPKLLEERAFVATLDGQRLYAGLLVSPGTSRHMDFPVLYVEINAPNLVLAVRPTHVMGGPYAIVPQDARPIVERAEVREHFLRTERLRP